MAKLADAADLKSAGPTRTVRVRLPVRPLPFEILMNPLTARLVTGTIGELIVQLRLLQFGVQSVPTHKDTGNDLLATRDETFRAFQVKATRATNDRINFNYAEAISKKFHILALVFLAGEEDRLDVDQCDIYLLGRDEVGKGSYRRDEIADKLLTRERIDDLFTRELRASGVAAAPEIQIRGAL
jgi:hypothetical protein